MYFIVIGNPKERFSYIEEIEEEEGRKSPRKKGDTDIRKEDPHGMICTT